MNPAPYEYPPSSTVSAATSAIRLAVAQKAMAQAVTLLDLVAAKNKAKSFGLTPKDTDTLRANFEKAKARFR
jgi:hypothetical protein